MGQDRRPEIGGAESLVEKGTREGPEKKGMITIKNLPFTNVVADGVATLELPLGMTYNRIILQLGGVALTKAMLTRIVGKLNGKIFFDITGARLDALQQYRSLAADASYLSLDFTEPRAKTIGGMLAGGIGTAEGVNSFTIQITIAGATAPTLESWSMVSEPEPLGAIFALTHYPVTFSAAGKFPIVLPHGAPAGHLIKRVNFFSAVMTSLEIKKNGVIIYEEVDTAIAEFIQGEYRKVPQAGLYVYDPVVTNDMRRVLDTADAKSLQFNVTVSGAGTVDVYPEYLTQLGLI